MEVPIILIIVFFLIAFTRIITVVIHEMGHALAGLILLKGEIAIYIGSYGDPKKGIHFGIRRLKVHFKYNPLLWSHGLCVSKTKEISLLKGYIFTLAGPLASLITGVICIYILINPEIHSAVRLISIFLFFSSLQDFFQNILPNENSILLYDGTITYNDGQTLKLLKQYKGIYNELLFLNQCLSKSEIKKGLDFFNEIYSRKKDVNLLRIGIALYIKNEQYSEAIELCNQLQSKTKLNSDDYCNYALAYSYLGEHEKALKLYDKSLQLNPNNFYSLNNRGYTLNILERYEEAIVDFDKAIAKHPKFAYAFNNRGLSKIKLGNENEGLSDINNSIELDDKNSYAYKNLGIYHKDKGELDEALKFFITARDYDEKTHGINELITETENALKACI